MTIQDDNQPTRRVSDVDIALIKQELRLHIDSNNRDHIVLDKKIDGAIDLISSIRYEVHIIARQIMCWQGAVLMAVITGSGGLIWFIWSNRILFFPVGLN